MRTGLLGYCDAPSFARGCADAAPAAAIVANTSNVAAAAQPRRVRIDRFKCDLVRFDQRERAVGEYRMYRNRGPSDLCGNGGIFIAALGDAVATDRMKPVKTFPEAL